jgi:hypothetical protein
VIPELEKVVAALPERIQFELESHLRSWQFRTGRFTPGELEYDLLPQLVRRSDWVLDIGANIRRYTIKLARHVGPTGCVAENVFPTVREVMAGMGFSHEKLLNSPNLLFRPAQGAASQ